MNRTQDRINYKPTAADKLKPKRKIQKPKNSLSRSKSEVNLLETHNKFEILTIEDTYFSESKDEKTLITVVKTETNKSKKCHSIPKYQVHNNRVSESSQYIFPNIIRCKKCFITHFPSAKICSKSKTPEMKISVRKMKFLCEFLSIKKVELKEDSAKGISKRVRGGVKHGSIPLMIRQAIESANKHGIKLVPGVRNNADGNCQYESVINNINHRPCFEQKLKHHPNEYRYQWITELEKEASKNPNIAACYSEEEKKKNWENIFRLV